MINRYITPILQVDDVVTGYGELRAVQGVSLTVAEGAIAGVVGPNGAGKSSFLRAIAGVLPLWEGTVQFAGRKLNRVPPHGRARKGIAFVQEGRHLFPSLTVHDNLDLGAYRSRRGDREERLAFVCDLFPPLRPLMKRPARVLSGGEQQMVAIGRALMSRPKCLLIDEPSLGLAPVVVDQIYEVLPELATAGPAIVLVEQEVARVFDVADSLSVVVEGVAVYSGDPHAFKRNPEALAELYLGARRAFEATEQRS